MTSEAFTWWIESHPFLTHTVFSAIGLQESHHLLKPRESVVVQNKMLLNLEKLYSVPVI